ncbi:tqsA [Symbiodinium sp. CCMP2592]|nr:tqsA [Symbiodinium sp. CCMP2592]
MACSWRGDSSAVRFPSVQSPSTGHGDVLEAESSQAQPSGDKELRFRALTESGYGLQREGLRSRGRDGLGDFRHADPGPTRSSHFKTASSQIRGLYLVKFAVSVTACYLTIQLLITFAEVLLPFIFAMLVVIVLEPMKKFVLTAFSNLAVCVLTALRMDFCVDNMSMHGFADGRLPSVDETTPVYGSLPDDSTTEDMPRPAKPVPCLKRFLVTISIIFCMLVSGRVLWMIARVFFRAGAVISSNLDFYKQGAERLKGWVQTYIHDLHISSLDYGELLDELVAEVEHIGSVVTQSVIYTAVQAVVTFIFLIYMLWSPVKVDGSAVKCLTSAFTGLSIGILLWAIGLDLPAAFGLLSFLANFLPGLGGSWHAALGATAVSGEDRVHKLSSLES